MRDRRDRRAGQLTDRFARAAHLADDWPALAGVFDDGGDGVDEGGFAEPAGGASTDLPNEQEVGERVQRQPIGGAGAQRRWLV